jgi:O-antigen ligase/Flp pilus assembly protein TadD
MRNPEPSSNRRNRPSSVARLLSSATVALLPVLACFLGGATQKWAEGIVLAILGFYLLIRPPRLSLGLALNCILAGLLLLAAIAFLPHSWFFAPDWRSAIVHDFEISLPPSLTPQPWMTASCLISFAAGLSWLYVVATQELDLRAVRFQLRLFAAGIVALAAISVLLYLAHITLPFWINQRGFGPFPNRNQTADLFGLTAIILLACTQDDVRSRRKRWIFWLAGLGVIVTAIILNFSRAGILILIGGVAVWIGANALRHRSAARIAVGLSVLLVLLSILLLMGGQTLERFHLRGFQGTGISSDFRWLIFQDAFQLIRSSPWCGIGLGNFDAIFAIFRDASIGDTRALHPESDWLWLWCELGWPAVLLAVAGAALLLRRVAPLKEGTNQRFRLAALIAALLFAVHGLVDVSAHRIGTSFSGILLLGLALHRPLSFKPSAWIPYLFRLVGLILIVTGIAWAAAVRGTNLLPGSVGVANAKKLAGIANRGRNFSEGIDISTHALAWAPLDWQLYFVRGLSETGAGQPAKALDDFRRARFLEPNAYEVPLAEGNLWLSSHPLQAVTAWREALRRAGPQQRGEVYSSMLSAAAVQKSSEVTRILEEVGLNQHDLALAFLCRVTGSPFNHGVAELLKRDPNLQMFDEEEKRAFFSLWSERGDLDQLAQIVQQHSEWVSFAWLGMATYHAKMNNFRDAYELTQRYGEAVALPRVAADFPFDELKKRFVAAPDNYAVGYALYREQIQRGLNDDALMTVRHFSERANSPAYFHFLEAQNWAAKENWERAWNAWRAYRAASSK